MGSFLVQRSPGLSTAHEGLLQSSSNLAVMGRHLLARPEWKNHGREVESQQSPACPLFKAPLCASQGQPAKHRYKVDHCFLFPELARSQLLISIR